MFTSYSDTKQFINTMVRGIYDLQKLRIQMGNRIVINFKNKFKEEFNSNNEEEISQEDLDKLTTKLINVIKKDYNRVADGVANDKNKIVPPAKFVPQGVITDYNEYILVRQYITLLDSEEEALTQLERVLLQIPIYKEYLQHITGLGRSIAGVIISEIDIYKSKTSSAIWRYAGLDTVMVGEYYDDDGKRHVINHIDFMDKYDQIEDGTPIFHDKYPVRRIHMARGTKEETKTLTTYIDKEGEEKIKKTIGYNPFLKTKLVGVLAGGFLKAGVANVDGKKCGAAKRLEMAVSEGFNPKDFDSDKIKTEVIKFLKDKGHDVLVEPTKYGKIYYSYRERLNHMPEHSTKTDKHKHQMALRYMIKRFLVDLYTNWRAMERLEVVEEYAVRKLGLVHHDTDYSDVE